METHTQIADGDKTKISAKDMMSTRKMVANERSPLYEQHEGKYLFFGVFIAELRKAPLIQGISDSFH